MKRGKKLLTYLFAVAMCAMASVFFNTQNALAAVQYSCVDVEGGECGAGTTDGYFVIERFEVEKGTTVLEFPSMHNDGTFNFKVGEIKGDAIVVLDGGVETNEKLTLTSLKLPTNLDTLNSNSLSNIEFVPSFYLPKTVTKINDRVFSDDAEVKTIYLEHKFVYIPMAGGGQDRKVLAVAQDAFSNARVEKIVCTSNDIYAQYSSSSTLGGARITTAVNYKFYSSKESMENSETPVKELTYYVGDKMIDLPTLSGVTNGMVHLGWWNDLTLLTTDTSVVFNLQVTSYDVYPKFDMTDLSFQISSNETSKTYTGNKDIITLQATNIVHPLTSQVGFNYSVKWYDSKGNEKPSDGGILRLSYVSDSDVYTCEVTYNYTYEGENYSKKSILNKAVEITPAFLYVEVLDARTIYGTYLTDDDLVLKTNGLLANDKIVNKTFSYHKTGNIQVGEYDDELKVSIHLITNAIDADVTNNYHIIYIYGTHIVEKKYLGAITCDEMEEVEYGEDIIMKYVKEVDLVYNNSYSNRIEVLLSREPGMKVGKYKFDGIESINNNNYSASFDISSTGELVIIPKKVFAQVDTTVFDDVYDGTIKNPNIHYVDINGVKVSLDVEFEREDYVTKEIIKAEAINAGVYSVIVKSVEDENYAVVNTTGLTFEVKKAVERPKYDPEQDFVYTGEVINPIVTIKNNEQTPTYICSNTGGNEGDYCKNAGVYSVIVNFNETENYNYYSTASLYPIEMTISQYSINLAPKTFQVNYGEKPELKEEMTINGEDIIIEYKTLAKKDSPIGVYAINGVDVYVKKGGYIHPNYTGKILLQECKQKVQITPRPLALYYNGHTNLVYDGNVKEIGAYLFDVLEDRIVRNVEIDIVVDEGEIKNAGTYHALATIDDARYEIINDTLLEFKVEKGTIDLSGIKFSNRNYVLNFRNHSVEVEGKLPDDVKVRYTINGKEGNSAAIGFENVVVAHFDVDLDNYNAVEGMSAILYIDMSWLIVVIIILVISAGIGVCAALLYASYRREHPRKIKLKIKTLSTEDLAAKRVATSVKEVLGDEEEKKRLDEEIAILEDENDLDDDAVNSQTFIERIYAASSELKYYYSEVKNELLSYEGISHSIDRKYEVFYHGTRQIAKLSICNGILRLYVNLDPQKYDKRQYDHKDMSKFECHEKTPLRIKVNTLETLRHAKVFIRIIRKKEKLESVSGFVRIDYEKFYTLKENFIPKLFKNMFSKEDAKKTKKK